MQVPSGKKLVLKGWVILIDSAQAGVCRKTGGLDHVASFFFYSSKMLAKIFFFFLHLENACGAYVGAVFGDGGSGERW